MKIRNFLKKTLAVVLVFAMLAPIMGNLKTNVNEVQAEGTEQEDVVKPDFMSVKCQVTQGVVTNTQIEKYKNNYVMRFVSSVDDYKNYKEVGFKIKYKENPEDSEYVEKTAVVKTVFKRIESTTGSTEDGKKETYTFSPKVISTDSEYLMTAKLPIAPEDKAVDYTVWAYGIKYDGTRVEGQRRCVCVNDGLKGCSTINMSFDKNDGVGMTDTATLTANDKYTAAVIGEDDTTVHVRISGVTTTLPSATKFTFKNGDTEVGSGILRNLYTEYTTSGTDTSWYDVYKTEGATEFVIASEEELYTLAKMSKSFTGNTNNFYGFTVYLVKDLEMNTFNTDGTWNKERVWPLIGLTGTKCSEVTSFNGTFDGQGHTISGIYSVTTEAEGRNAGLFTRITVNTTVKNLTLANSQIQAARQVGAIAGWADGGTYQNIHIEDTVKVTGQHSVAGIVGVIASDADALIENCWFEGHVSATNKTSDGLAGGLVASLKNDSGTHRLTVSNCLVEGIIDNNYQFTGGVCGYVAESYNLVVENTVAAPTAMSGADNTVGGVIGKNVGATEEKTNTIFNNVYTTAEKAMGSGVLLAGNQKASLRTSDDLNGENAFVNTMLNFESDWTVVEEDYPKLRVFVPEDEEQAEPTDVNRAIPADGDITWTKIYAGSEEEPYILKDGADLVGLAKQTKSAGGYQNFAGKYFVLANDITVNYDNSVTTNRLQWPIIGVVGGSSAPQYSFQGSFDGAGHTISGIYFQSADDNYRNAGLFSRIPSGATVKNFSMENSYIESTRHVGAIAGWADGGTYENVHIKDSVTVQAGYKVGGMLGCLAAAADTSISQCSSEATVTATLTNATENNSCAGGMIGNITSSSVKGAVFSNISFNQCISDADVTASMRFTGGFCGQSDYHNVVIQDCLSTAKLDVSAYTSWNPNAGGFVGYVKTGGTVNVSGSLGAPDITYNTEKATGTCGPIIGFADVNEDILISSTYVTFSGNGSNVERTFEEVVAGEIKGNAAQDKLPLLNWSIWTCVENDYPTLLFNATVAEGATPE